MGGNYDTIQKNRGRFKRIGKDGYYPTQLIVDVNKLQRVDETHFIDTETGLKFETRQGRLLTSVDGFEYVNCPFDGGYDEMVAARGKYVTMPTYGEDIGMFLNSISKEAIQKGVLLGDGMELTTRYPGKEVKIVETAYEYDGDSELLAFDCSIGEDEKGQELVIGTNAFGKSGHTNYDEEVVDYLKNKTDKMSM